MTFPTLVMQVRHIRLTAAAAHDLSHSSYNRVVDWLKNWTAPANFKAVLGESEADCLRRVREMLATNLVPGWLRDESKVLPKHFEFQVAEQVIDDGMFWMDSRVFCTTWHKVVEP